MVSHVATCAGLSTEFKYGNVCSELESSDNKAWVEYLELWDKPGLVFFAFVLWESRYGKQLVRQLWERCYIGSVFFFSDPNATVSLTGVIDGLVDGINCWWIEGTLFALKDC